MKTMLFLSLLIMGCGEINVSDSKHEIVHKIEIENIIEMAEELCLKKYTGYDNNDRDILIEQCIADISSQLLNVVDNG